MLIIKRPKRSSSSAISLTSKGTKVGLNVRGRKCEKGEAEKREAVWCIGDWKAPWQDKLTSYMACIESSWTCLLFQAKLFLQYHFLTSNSKYCSMHIQSHIRGINYLGSTVLTNLKIPFGIQKYMAVSNIYLLIPTFTIH